jgi:hypothetical protein
VKTSITFTILLTLAIPAQAALTPDDTAATARSAITEDAIMYDGPIGAMLERDYFRAVRSTADNENSCGPRWWLPHWQDHFGRSCE